MMSRERRKFLRRSQWIEALEGRCLLTIGFQPATSYAAGNGPTVIAAGDFDGDGKADIAVASTENLFVFLNDGKGSFRDARGYPATGKGTFTRTRFGRGGRPQRRRPP